MKRNVLVLITIVYGIFPLFSQNVAIPDAAFLYALIGEGVDANQDNLISYVEAEAVTTLDVYNKNISDLTGIEAFVKLENLYCSDNQLTNLNVTNNTALKILSCDGNKLTSLDVSNNTDLWRLTCDDNQLTNLDISGNSAINELHCGGNQLSNLDISSNFNNFLRDSKNSKGGGYNLLLGNMPSLFEVCVWTKNFPPDGFYVDTTDSPNVYFTTECSGSTEVKGYNLMGLSIYPNPANTLITIETVNPDLNSIEITSLNGQLIYCASTHGNSMQIDLTPFSNGIYFITVQSGWFVRTEKIIKL